MGPGSLVDDFSRWPSFLPGHPTQNRPKAERMGGPTDLGKTRLPNVPRANPKEELIEVVEPTSL